MAAKGPFFIAEPLKKGVYLLGRKASVASTLGVFKTPVFIRSNSLNFSSWNFSPLSVHHQGLTATFGSSTLISGTACRISHTASQHSLEHSTDSWVIIQPRQQKTLDTVPPMIRCSHGHWVAHMCRLHSHLLLEQMVSLSPSVDSLPLLPQNI